MIKFSMEAPYTEWPDDGGFMNRAPTGARIFHAEVGPDDTEALELLNVAFHALADLVGKHRA